MRMTVAFFVFGLSIGLHAQEEQSETGPAMPAFAAVHAQDMVIDGKLDEACWRRAAAASGDYINGKTKTPSEAPRATVRCAWDNDYLYLAYETFDANLIAIASGEMQGPKGNQRPGCAIWGPEKPDVVEFFISVDDGLFMWELHHNAGNEFNDVWCAVVPDDRPFRKSVHAIYGIRFCNAEFLGDDGEKTVALATALKPKADGAPSTVNEPGDTDTGYTAEIRIPWRALGVPVSWGLWVDADGTPVKQNHQKERFWIWRPEEKALRVLMVVQDSDLKQRYHHSSPTMPGGWFQHNFQHWPEYRLGN